MALVVGRGLPRVAVTLTVDAQGVSTVSVRVPRAEDPSPRQAKRRRSQNRQLELLRDFNGKGVRDTAANRAWASREEHRFAVRNSLEGKRYGCSCGGVRSRVTPELWCSGCEQFFHVPCERLDVSARALDKLRDNYLCTACERAQLEAAGLDALQAAHTAYECKYCEKVFTTERGILVHAVRCPNKPEERAWSCLCKGSKSATGGTQCAECTNWFHKKCRAEVRPSWEADEVKPEDDE
eukprot:CAMPEP_0185207856 /NCGR_PEP_ID=MMETSP1140-20130426/61046_1 /TAXON_ID=298111 /ORGANISM="Pavlova sp., Strain CCMP459" /LENGTH=237 /DNA_ID=CAMNT_0027775557 /DNA_START=150 /DNA_END=860 /DNA_ORIENTATION=+